MLGDVGRRRKYAGVCMCVSYYGLATASPYVGMAQKQDGGSNQCISVYTGYHCLGANAHV